MTLDPKTQMNFKNLSSSAVILLTVLSASALAAESAGSPDSSKERHIVLEKYEQRLVSSPTDREPLVSSTQCKLFSDGNVEIGHGMAKGIGAIVVVPVGPWTTIERPSLLTPQAIGTIQLMLIDAQKYGTRTVTNLRDALTDTVVAGYAPALPVMPGGPFVPGVEESFKQVALLQKESELKDQVNSSPNTAALLSLINRVCQH